MPDKIREPGSFARNTWVPDNKRLKKLLIHVRRNPNAG